MKGILRKDLCLGLIWVGLFSTGSAIAMEEVKTMGGFKISNPTDPAYWFALGGTLHLDETIFSGSAYDKQNTFPSGANIRRAYLDFQGGLGENLSYHLTLSFERPNTTIRAAYLNYQWAEDGNLQVGQVGIPSGLENSADPNDDLFLEPSLLTSAFFPDADYGLGIYANKTFDDILAVSGAIYEPKQGMANYGDSSRSDRVGEAIRLTVSPLHNESDVLHVGAWMRHQDLIATVAGAPVSSTTGFQGFSTVPEAQARTTGTLVNTGPIRAKNDNLAGLEAAAMCGPGLIQAEYLYANVHRVLTAPFPLGTKSSVNFYSWSIQGGYVLTGESHGYDFPSGTFSRVKPSKSGGAWEIAGRYSVINLNDSNIVGGLEHNTTVGLNWYFNEQVRVAANYIRVTSHPTSATSPGTAGTAKRGLDVVAMRLQVAF